MGIVIILIYVPGCLPGFAAGLDLMDDWRHQVGTTRSETDTDKP
jgi:hypothetical protein